MPNFLTIFQNNAVINIQNEQIAKDLMELNKVTEEYGIVLSKEDCKEIAEFRSATLKENERIEIGTGAVRRIIETFCESGYTSPQTFKDTVEGLLECFYILKSETDDKISDDEVLEFLKYLYEVESGGDISKIYETEAFDKFIYYGKKDINRNSYRSEDEDNDY